MSFDDYEAIDPYEYNGREDDLADYNDNEADDYRNEGLDDWDDEDDDDINIDAWDEDDLDDDFDYDAGE